MLEQLRNICRENFQADWFATDQPESADPAWTTPIRYDFNSRGFRDHEWPHDLQGVTWCIGDSELMGTGVAHEQSTPAHMTRLLGQPVLNISIIRASNDWIARQCHYILQALPTATVLLQWSFTTRSELTLDQAKDHELLGLYRSLRDPTWPELKGWSDLANLDQSLQEEIKCDPYYKKIAAMTGPQETGQIHYRKELLLDLAGARRLLDLIRDLETIKYSAKIIHAFVPRFAECQEREWIYQQLDSLGLSYIPEYQPLDLGRDRQHSGPRTHERFAQSLADLLAKL